METKEELKDKIKTLEANQKIIMSHIGLSKLDKDNSIKKLEIKKDDK